MKIQCDVCEKAEATVFCTADEAALCGGCDHRVHHANKLASKHPRFSLHRPQSKDSPLCDVCQEKRAFIFCQEDRAILCRECDIPIHRANELTQKHNRYLLTGVKLSASSLSHSSSSSSSVSASTSSNGHEVATNHFSNPNPNPNHQYYSIPSVSTSSRGDDTCGSQDCSFSTSNISDYLMDTFPGWQMDDLLDDPSCSPNGYCKTFDYELTLPDFDFETTLYPSLGDSALWVPQAPPKPCHTLQYLQPQSK